MEQKLAQCLLTIKKIETTATKLGVVCIEVHAALKTEKHFIQTDDSHSHSHAAVAVAAVLATRRKAFVDLCYFIVCLCKQSVYIHNCAQYIYIDDSHGIMIMIMEHLSNYFAVLCWYFSLSARIHTHRQTCRHTLICVIASIKSYALKTMGNISSCYSLFLFFGKAQFLIYMYIYFTVALSVCLSFFPLLRFFCFFFLH